MHILQINSEKGWRGGERQTLLSMEGLRDAGVQVTLCCLKNHPLHTQALIAGFPVIAVCNQFGIILHCLLHARRYSIIHAQSSRAFGFAALATIGMRTPLVYTRRVDFVPRGRLTRWKYRRAAALVAISRAIRDILYNEGMGNATVISSIVPDYKPDEKRANALIREQSLDGKKIVGIIAALVGHKDPITMVHAAYRVCKQFPDTVFLHFGDGSLRKNVEEEITRNAIGHSYFLCGHVAKVEDYFPLFNCLAMSSREEGLGSTVLDAFKNRTPVISTRAGGLAELVQGRGLLSNPGDADALANNIIFMLTHPDEAAKFTSTAYDYVVKEHSREVLSSRYITLYRQLCGL